ncbi:MAG: hypothetical protein NT159_15165 [Proteobacteria bacterium]|nr:hypothetical protein [Pseudomonadota bacterium]
MNPMVAMTLRNTGNGLAARASMAGDPCRGAEGEMAALTLNGRGLVRDCSRASEALFKYRRGDLVWRHVSLLLPQLAVLELVQNGEINPRLRFLCRIGHAFQAVTQDGKQFPSELFFNRINSPADESLTLIVRPASEEGG